MEYFKVFEDITRKSLEADSVNVDRLPDQMSGNLGSVNPGDFIAYKFPNEYYIECKTCTQSSFDIKTHISEGQWLALSRKSKFKTGVFVGYLIWFVEDMKIFWISSQDMTRIYKKKKSFSVFDLENSLSGYAAPVGWVVTKGTIKTPVGDVPRFSLSNLLDVIQNYPTAFIRKDKQFICDFLNAKIDPEENMMLSVDDVHQILDTVVGNRRYLIYTSVGFEQNLWFHAFSVDFSENYGLVQVTDSANF